MTTLLPTTAKGNFGCCNHGFAAAMLLCASLCCSNSLAAESLVDPFITEEHETSPPPVPTPVEKTDLLPPPSASKNTEQQNANTINKGVNNAHPIPTQEHSSSGEAADVDKQQNRTGSKKLPRKQNTSGIPLNIEQPLVIVPFKFPKNLSINIRTNPQDLSLRFDQELHDAFANQGFIILQPEQGQDPPSDTVVFYKPEQSTAGQPDNTDQPAVQGTDQLHVGRALILGEVFNIKVSPVNYMQIAGSARMNARVEVSGRALVEQETPAEILFTSKSFAGISNASARASEDINAHEVLYTQAINQALADCAQNLVRTLTSPQPATTTLP